MEEIKLIVRNFLSKFIANKGFLDDENIFELGYVNSLFAMEMIMFLEKKFVIQIGKEDLEIENFKSVTAITQFVAKKTLHAKDHTHESIIG